MRLIPSFIAMLLSVGMGCASHSQCKSTGSCCKPTADHPASAAAPESAPAMSGGMHDMNHDTSGMDHPMSGMKPVQQNTPIAATQPAVKYTCSMHPEVISDQPGNCPKCGMKLIKKEN